MKRDKCKFKVYNIQSKVNAHNRLPKLNSIGEANLYMIKLYRKDIISTKYKIRKMRSDAIFYTGTAAAYENKITLQIPCSKFTLLHEIAHCISKGHRHDKIWQQVFTNLLKACGYYKVAADLGKEFDTL